MVSPDYSPAQVLTKQTKCLNVATIDGEPLLPAQHTAMKPMTLVFTDYRQADVVFQLRQIATQATAAGVVSEPQATAWLEDLERARQRGTFFASVTGFCVSGEKP